MKLGQMMDSAQGYMGKGVEYLKQHSKGIGAGIISGVFVLTPFGMSIASSAEQKNLNVIVNIHCYFTLRKNMQNFLFT